MPAVCLMYHRIGRSDTDPWGLFVSPEHFEEQVALVTSTFRIVDPSRLLQPETHADPDEFSVCITFDDGYADNFATARPILEKYQCPATFFIPTRYIGSGELFWWDVLETIFLRAPVLPEILGLTIDRHSHSFAFSPAVLSGSIKKSIARWNWHEDAPSERCSAFLAVRELLMGLPASVQEDQIAALRAWSGVNAEASPANGAMNVGELQTLSRSSLFTVGLHTHSHCDLTSRSAAGQKEELLLCQNFLQTTCQVRPEILAYPYGKFDQRSIDAAAASGLSGCFTTRTGRITPASHRYLLNRCQVFDWPGQQLINEMTDWFAPRG